MQRLPIYAYLRLMRFDKPAGIWLLMWPCWWSLTLASGGDVPVILLVLFFLGAVFMRSAGCIINDMIDRDIDRQVERTRTRPLASGEVSMAEAFILLGFLLMLSLMIALMLGEFVVLLSTLWLPLVALYPLMKRITWWPQFFLGLTFNAGAIIGWVAVSGEVTLNALLLYLGCIFWTLGYDTIYGHQDKGDDARIGVKSSALRLGNRTKPFVILCYGVLHMMLMLVGYRLGAGVPYMLGLLLTMVMMTYHTCKVQLGQPAQCMQAFKTHQWMGGVIWLICMASGR